MSDNAPAPGLPSPARRPAGVSATGAIRTVGRGLAATVNALLLCWAILLVPVLLTLIAAGTDQGRDAILATASLAALAGPGFHAYAAQGVTTVLVTLSALTLLAGWEDGSPERRYAAHFVPGLVGLLAGYLPPVAFDWYRLSEGETGFWMAISRLVPPVFVILARDMLPRVTGNGHDRDDANLPIFAVGMVVSIAFIVSDSAFVIFGFAVASLAVADVWLSGRFGPVQRRVQRDVLILVALFAAGGGVLTALDPVGWGLAMGTYATLIVALNAWLAFGIVLWRWVRGALCGIAVAGLAYLLLTGPFGLGEVRVVEGRATPREDALTHARAWLAERRTDIERSPGPYPVFLVTADGGGIRAAWWSATLLGLIQDSAPGFSRQILAMSGVSGGSLGVAVFAAQVAQAADGEAASTGRACAGRAWSLCAEQVLGTDLLAPALAAMLTIDAPRTILRTRLLSDRAAAQEIGFEAAWQRVAGNDVLGQSFTALWGGRRRHSVPLLLLNTTEATTGRRVVIAPVRLAADTAERADLAPLLNDRDLRLSTAVLLSARFPGVSPAGWVAASGGEGGYALVDGGFADNSGARSASEMLSVLLRAAEAEGVRHRIRPIAIMIANDPLPAAPPSGVPGPGARADISTLGSLLAPVATLDRLRQSNTQRAKREFAEAVYAADGLVLDGFDLCEGPTAFPLGWMLAQGTRDAMAAQRGAMQGSATSALRQAIGISQQQTAGSAGSQPGPCRPAVGSAEAPALGSAAR